ncbi:MAG: formate dehydrogenase accessory sulfurtransferase FdhD [Anaerolineaceae bacterium]|nr:MAG: formate dehydrogenase family accessory protein FdhD [Chloroflexi bacterium HGW-Chloroflexi-8]
MINFTSNLPLIYNNGIWKEINQTSPEEIPVDLFVNGQFWLTFMCSPFQIEYLAIGFLFNEHIIHSKSDVASSWICKNNLTADIWLNFSVEKPKNWLRTSGCHGGQTSFQKTDEDYAIEAESICPDLILNLFENLLTFQEEYRKTRGIHCSALSDGDGTFLIAEDIGRHNTLDKLAGQFVMSPLNWKRKMILTTGRVSSEMLQKSAHIGANILISRTSPTNASIRTAQELNITLIGYARRNQFTVYAHPERIKTSQEVDNKIKIFCN